MNDIITEGDLDGLARAVTLFTPQYHDNYQPDAIPFDVIFIIYFRRSRCRD